nr:hypothetical protein [Thiomicrorhabdus sp.]
SSPPIGLGTQSYSFAAPMADAVYAAFNFGSLSVITFGVVAVIGLPVGAFLSSVIRKEFKTELGFFFAQRYSVECIRCRTGRNRQCIGYGLFSGSWFDRDFDLGVRFFFSTV